MELEFAKLGYLPNWNSSSTCFFLIPRKATYQEEIEFGKLNFGLELEFNKLEFQKQSN